MFTKGDLWTKMNDFSIVHDFRMMDKHKILISHCKKKKKNNLLECMHVSIINIVCLLSKQKKTQQWEINVLCLKKKGGLEKYVFGKHCAHIQQRRMLLKLELRTKDPVNGYSERVSYLNSKGLNTDCRPKRKLGTTCGQSTSLFV